MMKQVISSKHFKFLLILILNGLFFLASGCHYSASASGNTDSDKVFTAADNTTYINFRSFQNPDKSWGFTIFVNSMPFRQYSRIPYKRFSGGFLSKEEADIVAALFVSLIKAGDQSPKLDRKSIDTLGITISKMKTPPS